MTELFIPQQETSVFFDGPVGRIEAKTLCPLELKTNAVVIFCHPHPLFGGTMTNKVITTMARCFRDLGYRNLRFNFRGVGQTAGSYDQGLGETDDLLAIVSQLKAKLGTVPLILAGFSFGSYVAYKAAQTLSVDALISVAPPVERYDFGLPYPKSRWVIIIPEKDEVVTPAAMLAWEAALPVPHTCLKFPESGHFFHGYLVELKAALIEEFSLS